MTAENAPEFASCQQPSPPGEFFSTLLRGFTNPPTSHGPVPFYWWAGETLDRSRIAWQLDQLCEKGVHQTIISYPHLPNGHNDPGDPPLFSPAWWDLFRWFLGECRKRNMTAGFQDYTIIEPILTAIGRDTPDMQGGQMFCDSISATSGETVHLSAESGSLVISAWAYPLVNGTPDFTSALPLDSFIQKGLLEWTAPDGKWLVTLVFARPTPFDPLHPRSGPLAIEQLYAPFERECPGEVGQTLNLFFQDELSFGARMPFWSHFLFETFAATKGYDLRPLLPALWHDFGPITEKVRLDYSDAVTRRIEDCYFKPIFAWHEQRGTLFGHDNSGRGRMAQGRSFYGDYFRAMRWYSAPGCDDPKIQGARAFKGLKVNSSIAHFYQRPRVWVEAFHSSGWGTTPAEVVAALNEDFAYGATVVNLHGLYYTTRAGWWEWAPPDFHFRQPYWKHSGQLNTYFTRLSWLLSQGSHRCDAAILYPIAALDIEPADPASTGVIAHVGNEAIGDSETDHPHPEDSAFGIGKLLHDHACDFDFIDFESLAAATNHNGELLAHPGRYRVLILPAMAASHFSSMEKARDFVRTGGLVIAFGRLPHASERAGRQDPDFDALVTEIFGTTTSADDLIHSHPGGGMACLIQKNYAKVLELIDESIERDVISTVPLQVTHRHLPGQEIYYVFNPATSPVTAEVTFRSAGSASTWDPWTGNIRPLPPGNEHLLTFTPREAKIIVFHADGSGQQTETPSTPQSPFITPLDGLWNLTLEPTLDNQFGDFSLPASEEILGPQARSFLCQEILASVAPSDPANFHPTTFSYGPRLECHGPLAPSTDFPALEATLLENSASLDWQPYAFSLRWGIERDPFLTHWLSGPHGLKGYVPNEFLDFHSESPGSVWYLRATVVAPHDGEFSLLTGARCAYQLWINGTSAAIQESALPAGLYEPWNIPHYECEPRKTQVHLKQGENSLLLKLTQPDDQRTRAFFAFNPPAETPNALALRWFTDPTAPRPSLPASPSRRAIEFRITCPPGTREMHFTSRGPARAWLHDVEATITTLESLADGSQRVLATFPNPTPESATIILRIEAPLESRDGDALPEPVRFTCDAGLIPTGDWCQYGLACYSGSATYSREFEISNLKSQISIDLGHLSATAEVHLNGSLVATLVAPPWKCDLTPHLVSGKNQLAITVANTLANHYSVGIPSPYAFNHQTPSGLIGPVSLISQP